MPVPRARVSGSPFCIFVNNSLPLDTVCSIIVVRCETGSSRKRIQSWLENTPRDAPFDEVEAILKRYFPGHCLKKSGSHIVVTDDRLIGFRGFGPVGDFTVPVKSGQRVKGYYLKRLAQAINMIKELEREEDEGSGEEL